MSGGTEPSRASLRQAEAVARAATVRVRSMHLDLDLRQPAADTFGSTTTLEFDSQAATTFVEFAGAELVSVHLNGQSVDPPWEHGRLALTGLAPQNTLVVEGRMAYSGDGEALHRHLDPVDGQTYLYAMSFLDAAPRWFACFDQPDLKSRYALTVVAPPDWTVWGNGPAEQVAAGRWRIRPPQPLSTYGIALLAGPYVSVFDEHRGVSLGLHARASLGDRLRAEAADLLRVTKQSLDHYADTFAYPYPFGEYHQGFVPDFNAGAMENPGCVLFRDSFLDRPRSTFVERGQRAAVIAHEMAHMWFGNLVTMRWWSELWLNESFAEYAAHRCCREATDYRLSTEFGIVRKDWGMVADQSPSTHPVAVGGAADAAQALQDFDGIAYAKGAAVLIQLVAFLGDEVFLTGLRHYFRRHAYGNAELADLLGAWTEAGAVGLDAWAAAWLRQSGLDTLDVFESDAGLTVRRTGPAGAQPRTHALQVGIVAADGSVRRTGRTLLGADPVLVPDAAGAALVVPDAADETWAKVRFGAEGWRRLSEVLPRICDGGVLVVAGNAVRDAVRDGGLAPLDALTLLSERLPSGTDDVVWASLLTFAQHELCGPYSPPLERPARLARVESAARRRLTVAEPGSDAQLTAFRLLVQCCADPERLRLWTEGAGLPAGLVADEDLTWAAVERLAVLTDAQDVVERVLARDPSARGHIHAARARAARPDAEAKEQAWLLLTQPSSARPHELYATGRGFFPPEQAELTAPYVARYFAEIGATAAFRSGWLLASVAKHAFPWSAPSAEALQAAESTLAGDLAEPLRRTLRDETDRLARAHRSRQLHST